MGYEFLMPNVHRDRLTARPDTGQVERKLRLAAGLFEMAFRVKRFQLRQKHPEWSERELNHQAYALIEKGCK